MSRKSKLTAMAIAAAWLGALGAWAASAQDKDTVKVPNGLEYDAASGTFSPETKASKPPQAHDAKCGLACHTKVKARDYVFTEYAKR